MDSWFQSKKKYSREIFFYSQVLQGKENNWTCFTLNTVLKFLMSQGWQKCDDPSCGYTTRQVPLTLQRGAPMCTSCFRAHLHPAVSGVTDFCFLIKQFPLLNHYVVHLSKAMNGTLNLKKGFYIIADTLISQQLYVELMFRSCWSKSHLYLFCLYPV